MIASSPAAERVERVQAEVASPAAVAIGHDLRHGPSLKRRLGERKGRAPRAGGRIVLPRSRSPVWNCFSAGCRASERSNWPRGDASRATRSSRPTGCAAWSACAEDDLAAFCSTCSL